MNKLPKIFKINNDNLKDNNKQSCIVREQNINKEQIINTINKIFSNKYPFDIKVLINTKQKIIKGYLIEKNDLYIKTLHDEIINIEDIVNIEII